jgi:hypothetical protein
MLCAIAAEILHLLQTNRVLVVNGIAHTPAKMTLFCPAQFAICKGFVRASINRNLDVVSR